MEFGGKLANPRGQCGKGRIFAALQNHMMYIKRRETFCAAHRLFRPDWSSEQNWEVFGKCSHANYHGHNYVLWIAVKGEVDPETGMVMNFTELKRIIKSEITEVLDHKNLNVDIPWLEGKMTTAEVLAQEIWNILETPFKAIGVALHSIQLEETENNIVEYYGPNHHA